MGIFKPGDLVRSRETGEEHIVRLVPGMPKYDTHPYLKADKGMIIDDGSWVLQERYELVNQPTTASTSSYFDALDELMETMLASFGEISPVSSAIPTTMQKKEKYKIGDKVKCVRNPHSTTLTGLGWAVIVDDRGTCNDHGCKLWMIERFEKGGNKVQTGQYACEAFMAKYDEPKPKVVAIDEKALAPLVLNEGLKKEIISVLKQHENSNTIFEQWGLGETIKYGKGMSMLFHGGPGTGKTWAAHCIGKAMSRELLVVNAANIQTSEPGGANRNIEEAFKSAVTDNKILFLDECDSLITARNDVGMVLSSEINTLLTEIEKFEGVLILATNRADTLDEALERRLALIINFSNPDFVSRCEIWAHMLPKKMPLDKDVTIEALAEMALTGGQIKNALLQAARLAAAEKMKKIPLSTFQIAIKRIVQTKGVMGKRSRYHQHQEYDVSKGPAPTYTWQK